MVIGGDMTPTACVYCSVGWHRYEVKPTHVYGPECQCWCLVAKRKSAPMRYDRSRRYRNKDRLDLTAAEVDRYRNGEW